MADRGSAGQPAVPAQHQRARPTPPRSALSAGAWNTDDCRATHALYTSRGVEFIQEPQERPYGVEAVFRDPFGNWYSLNETNEKAFDRAALEQVYGTPS